MPVPFRLNHKETTAKFHFLSTITTLALTPSLAANDCVICK